ncbi:MAG: DHA2 family efflux MFS transporter permease subunit [Streptosporangiaceae bacterium]
MATQFSAQGQLSQRQILIVMSGLLLGMLLAALDQTIVATALPTIAGDLHGLSRLSWVVTAYLLASTVSTPLWGKLGDLYGRKVFFQAAIVIFLVGSVLAGLSQTMTELILFRALQGIGGGGLMVGAQTIVGDVVPPRDRGRYQGFFGAVFGVTSVIGPLIGGFFVDTLSWRWVFYMNLPIGAIALIVVAAVLPSRRGAGQHKVDYLGTIMIGGAATSLVLLTSLGGVTYPWGSGTIITLGVLAVAFTIAFIVAERRAAEPVLPLHLFRRRVFSAAGAIGFAVGFAMFGALTYLPQYQQVVRGISPTGSGLRLLPMMAGLLITSIGTGQLISRWGRYKIFPVAGTAVMTIGLYLLSHLSPTTSTLTASLSMLVLGAGIGATMQVLVIAVQNAVDYADLGAATSGATFFRSIGGSFGTAVFGAIFDHVLPGNISSALHGLKLPPGIGITSGASPAALDRLPSPCTQPWYRATPPPSGPCSWPPCRSARSPSFSRSRSRNCRCAGPRGRWTRPTGSRRPPARRSGPRTRRCGGRSARCCGTRCGTRSTRTWLPSPASASRRGPAGCCCGLVSTTARPGPGWRTAWGSAWPILATG